MKDLLNEEITELEIELNTLCNLKCVLCFRNVRKESPKQVRFKDLKAILDGFPNLKCVCLAGQTSEPTLNPELFEVIKYLKSRNVSIIIYTNAETKNDVYFKLLAAILGKTNTLVFTVFGSTQELHEKYRIGSSIDTVLRRYHLCKKLCNAQMQWITFRYNYEDFLKNGEAFKIKHGIPDKNFLVEDSLPFMDYFEYSCSDEFRPAKSVKRYSDIDPEHDGRCCADELKARILCADLSLHRCFLSRYYGSKYCNECSVKNMRIIKENKMRILNEFGDINAV